MRPKQHPVHSVDPSSLLRSRRKHQLRRLTALIFVFGHLAFCSSLLGLGDAHFCKHVGAAAAAEREAGPSQKIEEVIPKAFRCTLARIPNLQGCNSIPQGFSISPSRLFEALIEVLRHSAPRLGLETQEDGFLPVDAESSTMSNLEHSFTHSFARCRNFTNFHLLSGVQISSFAGRTFLDLLSSKIFAAHEMTSRQDILVVPALSHIPLLGRKRSRPMRSRLWIEEWHFEAPRQFVLASPLSKWLTAILTLKERAYTKEDEAKQRRICEARLGFRNCSCALHDSWSVRHFGGCPLAFAVGSAGACAAGVACFADASGGAASAGVADDAATNATALSI